MSHLSFILFFVAVFPLYPPGYYKDIRLDQIVLLHRKVREMILFNDVMIYNQFPLVEIFVAYGWTHGRTNIRVQ